MGPPDDPDAVVNHELKVKEILEPFSKTAVIIKYDISLWFSWVIEVYLNFHMTKVYDQP